jgi:Ca2+-binding RTX toxin-like protein
MQQFPSVIQLSALDGTNGFRLDGAVGEDSGLWVATAGDLNGDGRGDFLIGTRHGSPNGADSGRSYVVFGSTGFSSSLDLTALTGTTGFKLEGAAAFDYAGRALASAGDINGDGFADLIVGAPGTDENGGNAGSAYIVFGKASGFSSSLFLSALDGTAGFRLTGAAGGDLAGYAVASAGDINNDGFDDLLIGAPGTAVNGAGSGSAYVVFGKASGFGSALNLSSLNGGNGFRIDGELAGDGAGFSVASADDVNGDGFADLVIGGPNVNSMAGAAYIVFGKASGFASSLNLSALNGANGFRLSGAFNSDRAGISISGAGDVNGDGFADVIVGASWADANGTNSGSSYVVFGRAGGFPSALELSALDGANGFRLDGGAALVYSGCSVSAAGDVNGDGFGDLIVGADRAGHNGPQSGAAYVVFGKASGFSSALNLVNLDGHSGFRLEGAGPGDYTGLSVSAAGDVNGDGFADLIAGAPGAGTGGASYVIYGHKPLVGVSIMGTAIANRINGGIDDDTVNGLSGNDTIWGHTGDDHLSGSGGNDSVDAGTGVDTVNGGSGNDTILGGTGSDLIAGGDGNDTIDAGSGDNAADGGTGADSILAGSGDDSLNGAEDNDTINGGSGDDTILGGSGSDQLTGGAGDDSLSGGSLNDTFIFTIGFGIDTVSGGSGIDTLSFSGLTGGAGIAADLVTRVVTLGEDSVTFSSIERVTGSNFADTITGNAGANLLSGLSGADTISAGAGNDTVAGGGNRDVLTGGLGNDVFDYNAITESSASTVNRDLILDFNADGAGDPLNADQIDLSTIDANADGGTSNDAFTFMGAGAFTGLGQVRVIQSGGNTLIEINTTGANAADMRIELVGLLTLDQADFIL